MEVEFRRSGERRYAARILRPGLPVLEKDPAPGFDALSARWMKLGAGEVITSTWPEKSS